MSHRTGDRARADKRAKKRRVRRIRMEPLRKAANAAKLRSAAAPKETSAPA